MKCFLLGLAALSLGGCAAMLAPASNPFQDLRVRCVQAWGPENTWTPQQEATYQDAMQRLYVTNVASAPVASSRPIYQPPAPPQFTQTHYGSQGTTSTVKPGPNGSYTIWNSDGTTANAVPDGRGGYTIWR